MLNLSHGYKAVLFNAFLKALFRPAGASCSREVLLQKPAGHEFNI